MTAYDQHVLQRELNRILTEAVASLADMHARAAKADATLLRHFITSAIDFLHEHGYRVSKPRAKRKQSNGQLTLIDKQPTLNAIGKPFAPQYSADYRMTHKPPRLPRRRFRPRTLRSRDIRFEQR
jgi:hypothetical protein